MRKLRQRRSNPTAGSSPKRFCANGSWAIAYVVRLKSGPTQKRYTAAFLGDAFDSIPRIPLLQTRSSQILKVLEVGMVDRFPAERALECGREPRLSNEVTGQKIKRSCHLYFLPAPNFMNLENAGFSQASARLDLLARTVLRSRSTTD
jgi:hypothetical protein